MPQVGDSFGPYLLAEYLGGGAFGAVYRAEKRSGLKLNVAIKIPYDQTGGRQAMMKEAEAWRRASGHPNIVPVLDADVYNGFFAIVSEYVAEGSLRRMIGCRTGRGLAPAEAIRLTDGILAGLERLHALHIIHRDLKPENILMQAGVPRITDFGVAKTLSRSGGAASSAGTLLYMPPESFRGQVDARSDLWSVGVILYELLSGQLPFDGETQQAIMFAILQHPAHSLSVSVPRSLRTSVEKALEKSAARRYQSAMAMRTELHEVSLRLRTTPKPASKRIGSLYSYLRPQLFVRNVVSWLPNLTQLHRNQKTKPVTANRFITRRQMMFAGQVLIVIGIGSLGGWGLKQYLMGRSDDTSIAIPNYNDPFVKQRREEAKKIIYQGDQLARKGDLDGARVKWTEATSRAPGTPERDMAERRLKQTQPKFHPLDEP